MVVNRYFSIVAGDLASHGNSELVMVCRMVPADYGLGINREQAGEFCFFAAEMQIPRCARNDKLVGSGIYETASIAVPG